MQRLLPWGARAAASAAGDVAGRMAALRSRLASYEQAYYGGDGVSRVSDATYDRCVDELKALEAAHPSLGPFPQRPIGAPVGATASRVVQHRVPMLSLEKCASVEELAVLWARIKATLGSADVPLVAEPKIDGISLSLEYAHGRLVGAATRGDGQHGEDVLARASAMPDVPPTLPFPRHVLVRGEAFVSQAELAAANAQRQQLQLPPYATCRNAAAGGIRVPLAAAAPGPPLQLRFFAYQVAVLEGPPVATTHWDHLQLLRQWGFRVQADSRLLHTPADLSDYWLELTSRRPSLGYDADGAVFKAR